MPRARLYRIDHSGAPRVRHRRSNEEHGADDPQCEDERNGRYQSKPPAVGSPTTGLRCYASAADAGTRGCTRNSPAHRRRLLVSGGHEPHMTNMTPRENPQGDATYHAAAIARWDDEGGAFAFPSTEGSKTGRSTRVAGARASVKVDQSLGEEDHILDCLGAAVMMRWGTLPTKIQRELFEYATSLADLTQAPQLRGQIARYLHNHKNEDARTTRTMPRQDVT